MYSRADSASTIPLQMELALRNIPFAIAEPQRFPDASVFQSAVQAWTNDAAPKCDPRDVALVDAMAATLERIMDTEDSWVWLDRIDHLTDDDTIGTEGIQFTPQ